MNLSKLKASDYVLFLDGTVARVVKISQGHSDFHLYFDKKIRGNDDTKLNDWFYTMEGLWGNVPGDGNDIIKILEDNNESE